MKKLQHNSNRASALQIALLVAVLSTFAILLAIAAPTKPASQQNPLGSQPEGTVPTLGNYPAASILLSTDTTVTPDATPTNTTRITVSSTTNFNGKLEGYPATGVVRVTDAHPAGTYTVTVKAFDSGGASTTKMFTLTVTTPATCIPVSFGAPNAFGAGASAHSVAVGDFNGDGNQDLAVANSGESNDVSILLGNGAGSFSASNFAAGPNPSSVAVGDFNGDGKQDLAVSNVSAANVSIFLGNGAGTFSPPTDFAVGTNPYFVAVGDFNGDGKQDLAVANHDSNNVSILLGNGAGLFSAPTNFGAGNLPVSIAVGDFDGDGNQDLAVAKESGGVSILLGNGAGSFSAATNFGAGSFPQSVAVGDFNGDSRQDLAVVNYVSSNVSILLGDGAGHFSAPTNFGAGSLSTSIAVGDFDGDGKQDLAVANGGSNNASILLGDGAGHFSAPTNFGADSFPQSVAVGDFNGDGKQDLAVVNILSDNVSILLRDCTLSTPTPTPAFVSISGNAVYCPNASLHPVPGVMMTLTGTSGGSTSTDGSGNYTFVSLPSGGSYTVTPTKAALLPGSPGIDTVDVIAIQRHFLQIAPLPGCRLKAADVNGDNTVNTVDVQATQRFFFNRTTGIANTGKYQFTPASRTYPGVGSNQTGQNYDTLVFGDVATPFAP